jgi:hypothetical protein
MNTNEPKARTYLLTRELSKIFEAAGVRTGNWDRFELTASHDGCIFITFHLGELQLERTFFRSGKTITALADALNLPYADKTLEAFGVVADCDPDHDLVCLNVTRRISPAQCEDFAKALKNGLDARHKLAADPEPVETSLDAAS